MNLSTDLSTSSSIQKSAYSQTDAPITVSPKGSAALSGLSSGQTFQAEVVSREGNEATLRLENGQTVNARLGSEIPLEPGKLLTFEVRQSGQTLSISPLQTNLSADPNAVRALQMANLPISGTSVEMTTLMMKAGMSIDRASLQQMLSRVTANPGAGPGDIIDLTRLGMKVTPENLEQLSAYKNLSYQIGDGMREVAGKLSDALMQLTGAGAGDASVSGGVDLSAASSLMQGLLEAAAAFEDAAGTGAVPAAAQGAETAAGNQVMADPGQTGAAVGAAEGGEAQEGAAAQTGLPEEISAGRAAAGSEVGAGNPAGDAAANFRAAGAEAAGGPGPEAGALQAGNETSASSDAASRALELLKAMGQAPEEAELSGAAQHAREPAGAAERGTDAASMQAQQTKAPPPYRMPLPDEQSTHLAQLSADLEKLSQSDPELAQQIREETGDRPLSDLSGGELLKLSAALLGRASAAGEGRNAQALLHMPSLKNALFSTLQKQWSIEPKDVARKEEVQELYRRLDAQLSAIRGALEGAGMQKSDAFQAASHMNQNLDFLNQLNQMYAYVQLPLHLEGRETGHGDLYVYSNGKRLSSKDGSVSALLHLDMENLGPVDVYASLNLNSPTQKVTTQFYVRDDEVLDFLEAHMDLLTARLEKRGYSCSCKMTLRGEAAEPETQKAQSGGVNVLLAHLGGGIRYSGSSFDART
ncbi:MAG: flagellar hook-length control protein FliK [Lachnospiraceae bacterium]|nr:flagellar hook-length control protein FliK [Lachnospiraceae bacterium]